MLLPQVSMVTISPERNSSHLCQFAPGTFPNCCRGIIPLWISKCMARTVSVTLILLPGVPMQHPEVAHGSLSRSWRWLISIWVWPAMAPAVEFRTCHMGFGRSQLRCGRLKPGLVGGNEILTMAESHFSWDVFTDGFINMTFFKRRIRPWIAPQAQASDAQSFIQHAQRPSGISVLLQIQCWSSRQTDRLKPRKTHFNSSIKNHEKYTAACKMYA